jgi:hypothetical protein
VIRCFRAVRTSGNAKLRGLLRCFSLRFLEDFRGFQLSSSLFFSFLCFEALKKLKNFTKNLNLKLQKSTPGNYR